MASSPNEEPCCVIPNTFSVSQQTDTQSNVPEVRSDNLVNSSPTDGLETQASKAYSQDITGLQNELNPTSSTQQTFSSNATSMDIDTSDPWELDFLIANEFISESGFLSTDPLRLGFDPFAPVTLGTDIPLTDPLALDPLLPDTTDAFLTGPTSGGNLSNNDLGPALEHFVLESLDTIAQATGCRRPFEQEPMGEEANSAKHCTHESPIIEHPSIYSPVQPELVDMEWNENLLSDIQQEVDTSSIHSGNIDFPTDGTSSYSQDEFETDEPLILEEPIPSLTSEFCFYENNRFNPETTDDIDDCLQYMHDDDLCSGTAMFTWLLDAIRWLNCDVSRDKNSQNALRTTLIPLEKAYDIIVAARYKFTTDFVSNSHHNHHHFYCDQQPAPSTDEVEATAYCNQPKDDNVEVITLD